MIHAADEIGGVVIVVAGGNLTGSRADREARRSELVRGFVVDAGKQGLAVELGQGELHRRLCGACQVGRDQGVGA